MHGSVTVRHRILLEPCPFVLGHYLLVRVPYKAIEQDRIVYFPKTKARPAGFSDSSSSLSNIFLEPPCPAPIMRSISGNNARQMHL